MTRSVFSIKELIRQSIDSTPKQVSTFFKTKPNSYGAHDQFLGITVPTLRNIAQKYLFITRDELQELIQSQFNEERLLAIIIATKQYACASDQQKEEIYQFYKANLCYINNWNLVDSSAHLIIGAHLFTKDRSFIKQLAQSQSMWERRIAIVSTWYFIRKNDLEWTFFIAKILHRDSHDLIHKAVGWMLRETGKKDETQLMSFLLKYASQMPKTMVRYATERLSKEQKMSIKMLQSIDI